MSSLYFSAAEISNFDSIKRFATDSTGSFFSEVFWVLSISSVSAHELMREMMPIRKKNGWVLIRKGDLVPPSPLASLQQKLASGRPLLDSYREFNPGAPLKQLAREIEERRSWERYLLRDRWRRWVKSVVVYGGFVAKVLPEIAAGISELQSR